MDIRFDQRAFDIELVVGGDELVDIAITKDSTEDLMQRLFLRLKAYPKDLFWNYRYGIDYLNTVFGKNRPKYTVDIIFRNEILKEPMIDKIESFESEIVNYSYACKFSVKLRYEPTIATFYILTNEDGAILTNENGDTLTSLI